MGKRLTFYDASYITTAKNTGANLVTEDEKLQKTASKFIKTITYTSLESRLIQKITIKNDNTTLKHYAHQNQEEKLKILI